MEGAFDFLLVVKWLGDPHEFWFHGFKIGHVLQGLNGGAAEIDLWSRFKFFLFTKFSFEDPDFLLQSLDEIFVLTDKILNNPLKILVKEEELTLEGIKQYYIYIGNQEKYKFYELLTNDVMQTPGKMERPY